MQNKREGMPRTEQQDPTKEELLEKLADHLNNYLDEIPTEKTLASKNYKVRGNWFQSALSHIKYALDFYPNTDLLEKIKSFEDTFKNRRKPALEEMLRSERSNNFVATTEIEIFTMDNLLQEAMNHLQNN